ncbi:5'/3'-nucleotidase SurE [Cellulomonas triticagri]|uniref:5'-nucleotidase n=1 Tax=Cellulomonas triticagri TaxID=2483352 RepID=A0A3M2JGI0_9CELL|nr:5'/3'-nucleotidase SurE [Cellulomonas triticagri]RMI12932.1 5'/3'-nucleotidase SurE [Cellulomonas triticagri]
MRVLVTNDDGIESPGLAVLARAALDAGADEVVVAAPARDSSGASASLLGAEQDGRLLVERTDAPDLPDGVTSYAVRAAPALIAFVAAHGGFGPKPDLVLSGVNRGANTGHAVLHSGTVGAALSAATHGIRGVAVSLADARPQHWDTAGLYTRHVLDWLADRPHLPDRVVNLNVPDRPAAEVRGLRKAPLAAFGAVQARVHEVEHGNLMLTYAEHGGSQEPDTDAGLLLRGWATVTLVHAPAFDADADLPERDAPLL